MKKLIQKWLGITKIQRMVGIKQYNDVEITAPYALAKMKDIQEIKDKLNKLQAINFSQVKGMALVDITKIEERLDNLECNGFEDIN
jgi:hypothetical protein